MKLGFLDFNMLPGSFDPDGLAKKFKLQGVRLDGPAESKTDAVRGEGVTVSCPEQRSDLNEPS